MPRRVQLEEQPGHLVRRLQQIAVALFLEETAGQDITPVQFAALQAVENQAGLDQRSLAATVALDTSTLAGVVDRLEARGLLERQASPSDRRVRLLAITQAGRAALATARPGMLRAQKNLLQPLNATERAEFVRLLGHLVNAHNQRSRAPRQA